MTTHVNEATRLAGTYVMLASTYNGTLLFYYITTRQHQDFSVAKYLCITSSSNSLEYLLYPTEEFSEQAPCQISNLTYAIMSI